MDDFVFVCENGYFQKAQEMYSSENIDIHYNEDEPFEMACAKGHIDIAKWLYSLGDVNIHSNEEFAFTSSCNNGHIDVAKWLYSLGDVDIHADNEGAFLSACQKGHLEIAKWLYSFGDMNINACDIIHGTAHVVFKLCCIQQRVETVKWLCEIYPNYHANITENNISRYWTYGEILNNIRYTKINTNDECSICLENKNYMILTKCKHTFCYECIIQWKKFNIFCPYCRQQNL